MTITAKKIELRTVNVKMRIPFRYGIATLSEAPQVFVFTEFDLDGQRELGVAADLLPPRWFTKNPNARHQQEIEEMLLVIRRAAEHAKEVGEQPNVFHWWRELYQAQTTASDLEQLPMLLRGFGASLLERTAIDAFCKRHRTTFSASVQEGQLGIQLDCFHSQLHGSQPKDFLPSKPSEAILVRHTVGLSDPLTAASVADEDDPCDGLPVALEDCIKHYGLKYLKIKLPRNLEEARERLTVISRITARSNHSMRFTLDGNEFFDCMDSFRSYWEKLLAAPELCSFIAAGLIVVEQPLHRDVAFAATVQQALQNWGDHPPIIIDESDGEIGSFSRALEAGYQGTSHKNCKGVFKGLANACLINHLNSKAGGPRHILTGEDLANIGPVALQQDLAVCATLGLEHVERNGHHFVSGLSHLEDAAQRELLTTHGDLYHQHLSGSASFATMSIDEGKISLDSVNSAPFGNRANMEPSSLECMASIE